MGLELALYSYEIKYRPGKQNVGPDALSRAFCSPLSFSSSLHEIHNNLCHPEVTKMLHFVLTKNLLFRHPMLKMLFRHAKLAPK